MEGLLEKIWTLMEFRRMTTRIINSGIPALIAPALIAVGDAKREVDELALRLGVDVRVLYKPNLW